MVKRTPTEKVFYVFNVLLMLLMCFVILYPYANVAAISLNDGSKAVPSGLMLLPKALTFSNYGALLGNESIWRSLLVTLGRILLGVLLHIVICFVTAYGLTRKKLPFRKTLTMFFFIPSYISGGLIPVYILYAKLGLLNNPLVYILPGAFSFFNYILFRTYIGTIPESLEESAKIDGAGEIHIMLRIYLPLCVPIIATISLFGVVNHWNDWTTTLYFMSNNKWNTLAFELYRVLSEQSRLFALLQQAVMEGKIPQQTPATSEGLRNAQIIISTVPILAVYPFLQKYFIKGLLIGGVKE